MCLPYGLRDMYMMRLSAFNEYGSGVIDILIGSARHIGWCIVGSGVIDILLGSVCHIGWRIVGRQAIWREGVLVLNLNIMELSVLPKYLPTISEVG